MKNWFLWLVGAAIVISAISKGSNDEPQPRRHSNQSYEAPADIAAARASPQLASEMLVEQSSSDYATDEEGESEIAYSDQPYRRPQSANHIGGTTFYSDGTTAQRIGDATFYSDGTTAQRIGDSTFYSDGTTAQRIGDATFYSDGTTAQKIGDATFFSDGTTCQTIGDSTFCN